MGADHGMSNLCHAGEYRDNSGNSDCRSTEQDGVIKRKTFCFEFG